MKFGAVVLHVVRVAIQILWVICCFLIGCCTACFLYHLINQVVPYWAYMVMASDITIISDVFLFWRNHIYTIPIVAVFVNFMSSSGVAMISTTVLSTISAVIAKILYVAVSAEFNYKLNHGLLYGFGNAEVQRQHTDNMDLQYALLKAQAENEVLREQQALYADRSMASGLSQKNS